MAFEFSREPADRDVERMLRMPRGFADAIVEQARAEYPNEACGLVGGKDGVATKLYRMANAERSPVIFRMDSKEQFRVQVEMEEEDLSLVAIYHSHPRSAAYPSATDVDQSRWWPGVIYLIVSLAEPDAPDLRGFRIQDGKISEVQLVFEES